MTRQHTHAARSVLAVALALVALHLVAATSASAAPATPTNLRVTAATTTSLTYTWNASPGATKYRLWYGTNANGSKATKREVGNVTSTTITGLKPGTTYYTDIAAINSSGQLSAYTSKLAAKTSAGAAPATPTNLRVTASTTTSLTYSWNASPGATKYRLWYGTNANGTQATKREVGNVTSTTITGLKPGTTYHADIAAINSAGQLSAYTSRLAASTNAPAVGTEVNRIFTDTNAARTANSRAPLILNASLNSVAQAWAQRMGTSPCSFTHNPNLGSQVPAGWSRVGENIARGYTVANVVTAWMNSSSHRANILGDFTHIGIGYVGSTACSGPQYVQVFAKY